MARKSKNQAPIVVIPTTRPDVQASEPAPTSADNFQATDATTPAESSNLDATPADATPAPSPVKPFDPGLPIATHVDSSVKPDPSVNATGATDSAPLPCVVVPNIQAPAPYAPKLTAPSVVKAESYVSDVARILNVANADILGWGRFVQDIMTTERENSTRFGADEFDATIKELGALYSDRFPHSEATPRVQSHFDYAGFMDVCTTLGIIGAERIAYGRVVNRLHPATCDRVKDSATTIVKDGWADWLRAIVPMIIRTDNPLSDDTIIASIDAQRVALNALDPKKYPLPRKRATKAETPAPTTPIPTPVKPDANATPSAPKAPIVPTEIVPNVNPGIVQMTPAPTPVKATTPAPSVKPVNLDATPAPTPAESSKPEPAPNTPARFDVVAYVKGLDVVQATALGKALADVATDDACSIIMVALANRARAIQASKAKSA